jgi:hypothetical protein
MAWSLKKALKKAAKKVVKAAKKELLMRKVAFLMFGYHTRGDSPPVMLRPVGWRSGLASEFLRSASFSKYRQTA